MQRGTGRTLLEHDAVMAQVPVQGNAGVGVIDARLGIDDITILGQPQRDLTRPAHATHHDRLSHGIADVQDVDGAQARAMVEHLVAPPGRTHGLPRPTSRVA